MEWTPLSMWASDPTVDPENWRAYSYCDTAEGVKQTVHLYYWIRVTTVFLDDLNDTFSARLRVMSWKFNFSIVPTPGTVMLKHTWGGGGKSFMHFEAGSFECKNYNTDSRFSNLWKIEVTFFSETPCSRCWLVVKRCQCVTAVSNVAGRCKKIRCLKAGRWGTRATEYATSSTTTLAQPRFKTLAAASLKGQSATCTDSSWVCSTYHWLTQWCVQ